MELELEPELEPILPQPAAAEQPGPLDAAANSDRAREELEELPKSELMHLAHEEGLDNASIAEAADSNSVKEALIDLILKHRTAGGERAVLLELKPSELHERAWASGASEVDVAIAWDSDDHKNALVELLIKQGNANPTVSPANASGGSQMWALSPRPTTSSSPRPTSTGRSSVLTRAASSDSLDPNLNNIAELLGIDEESDAEEQAATTPAKDPMFKMESCTIHVRGIPADTKCDQDWLREIFGVFGDFIQGTVRRPREGLGYALISFRDQDDVQNLLKKARYSEIQSSRSILKKAKGPPPRAEDQNAASSGAAPQPREWRILLRSFERDPRSEKEATEWCEGVSKGGEEARLWMSPFDSEAAATGKGGSHLSETYDDAVIMARNVMKDLHLFLAIECGRNLPAMDSVGSDAFCQVDFAEKPQVPAHKEGRANLGGFEKGAIREKSCCEGKDKDAPVPTTKNTYLGRTRTESLYWANPNWLWNMSSAHRIAGIGKRGWVIIQVLDEDVLDNAVVGEIQINLDEVAADSITESWYAIAPPAEVVDGFCIGENDSLGCIKVRMLISSHPYLSDKSNSWLLDDYSIPLILETANGMKSTGNAEQKNEKGESYQEREGDKRRIQQLQADHARLLWKLDTVIDTAFQHIDKDNYGTLEPSEIGWMMEALGERLSQIELAQMIAECKAWGLPSRKQLKRMERDCLVDPHFHTHLMKALGNQLSQIELTEILAQCKACGLPSRRTLERMQADPSGSFSELLVEVTRQLQFEMSKRLLKQWSNKSANRGGGPPQPGLAIGLEDDSTEIVDAIDDSTAIWIDLKSTHCSLSRTEFKTMLTDYQLRYHDSLLGAPVTSIPVEPAETTPRIARSASQKMIPIEYYTEKISPDEWTRAREQRHAIRITKDAAGNMDATRQPNACRRMCSCKKPEEVKTKKASAVPEWLSDITRTKPIDPELRDPETFWKELRSKMQQVVMRADNKGITAGEQNMSAADKLALEAFHAMKSRSIRSVGSPDGVSQPTGFSIAWDLMQVMLLMWVVTSVPFGIAFDVEVVEYSTLWWWELWVDTYFVLDICLSFRTPYYDNHGALHYSSRDMAVHYLLSWFVPDVLSCASMIQYVQNMKEEDLFGSAGGEDGEGPAGSRLAKLVRLTKLAKLLRLARMKRALSRLSDYAFERFGGNFMVALGAVGKVFNLIAGFILAMHLIACVYYMIGDDDDGWVPVAFPIGEEEILDRYFQSMMTVALGSFPEESTPKEEVFGIFSVLINGFVFGAVAATFSSIMVELNEPFVAFNSRIDELKSWMRNQHFDTQSQNQVEEFYAAKLSGGNGSNKLIDEVSILNEFQPAPLVEELVTILYTDFIKQVPIFASLKDEVVSKLCLNLRPLPALKGAPVCIQGCIAENMYIVRKGRLQTWENSNSVPMMARCTLQSKDTNAPQFWCTVYDAVTYDAELETDFIERSHMKLELGRLTMKALIEQGKSDGVEQSVIDKCMDSHSDPIQAIIRVASGGTVDTGGQEANKVLQHRSLDRKNTHIRGTARHASNPYPGALAPRKRYWKNFDPMEGEKTFRVGQTVKIGSSLNVIEVRRGNVLGYLNEGSYTGEQTFLDSAKVVRYQTNITAMEDTQLLYLTKDSLVKVREAFPEVQYSIQDVLHIREKNERQRRLFSDAARGDDTLSITELHKMLADKLFFTEEDIAAVKIDHAADSIIDEYEFDAWFRSFNAKEQESFRADMKKLNLGQLIRWADNAGLEPDQLKKCLTDPFPVKAIIDKILSVPKFVSLLRRNAGPDATTENSEVLADTIEKMEFSHMDLGDLYAEAHRVGVGPHELEAALSGSTDRLELAEALKSRIADTLRQARHKVRQARQEASVGERLEKLESGIEEIKALLHAADRGQVRQEVEGVARGIRGLLDPHEGASGGAEDAQATGSP